MDTGHFQRASHTVPQLSPTASPRRPGHRDRLPERRVLGEAPLLRWGKLPFYAAHGVDELLIVDPQKRSVDWLSLTGGSYEPIERSDLIDLGAAELSQRIDWP
ncbi:MAG: Uma2 family endonuclease [Solirubrobacteraceae bacterium]